MTEYRWFSKCAGRRYWTVTADLYQELPDEESREYRYCIYCSNSEFYRTEADAWHQNLLTDDFITLDQDVQLTAAECFQDFSNLIFGVAMYFVRDNEVGMNQGREGGR